MKNRLEGYEGLKGLGESERQAGTSGYLSREDSPFDNQQLPTPDSSSTSGSIASQSPVIKDILGSSHVLHEVTNSIDQIINQDVRTSVLDFLLIFQNVLQSYDPKTIDSGSLSPLRLAPAEDGSALVEWIFKDFRIGFSFEPDPQESSWYLVSNQNMGEVNSSGALDSVDISSLITNMINLVQGNS